MYFHLDVVYHDGSYEKEKEHTHTVSLWHIPGGFAYDRAEVVAVYFKKEEEAKAFQQKYRNPPEMATVWRTNHA